jgi:two-component system sensor histidine kinase AlgZ
MNRKPLPLPALIALWAALSALAGAATGMAVGVFRAGALDLTLIRISILFGIVVGLTSLLVTNVVGPRLREFHPVVRGTVQVLALLAGAIAGTALVLYLFPFFVLADARQTFALLAINATLALVVGSVVALYEDLRRRLAESLRDVEEVRLVEAQLKEHAARAELAALQARINPHFFFNTLNTISSLLEEDPGQADDVLQKLAGLFRYTFHAADARPVALSQELDFIRDYLEIERALFGDRVRIEMDIDPGVLAVPVPGLVLQPLVENAVGHGLAPLPMGGTVRVSARAAGGDLVIEVSDDGRGLGSTAPEALVLDGHGLGNVLQRLKTLYRKRGTLEIAPAPGGRGTVSRLRLPLPEPGGDGLETRPAQASA